MPKEGNREGIEEELRRYIEKQEEAERTEEVTQKATPKAPAEGAVQRPDSNTGFFELPPELAEQRKDSEPPVSMSEIVAETRVMLENPDVDVLAGLKQILEKHNVYDWSPNKREQVFNTMVGPLKKVESEKSLAAWEEAGREADEQGWGLGHPKRQELIQQKLELLTKQYTEPYFELYDLLQLKPKDDDEDTRRGRTVLD